MAFTYNSAGAQTGLGSTDDFVIAYTAGANSKLVVLTLCGFSAGATSRGDVAPTYNGSNMTQVGTAQTSAEGWTEMWFYLSPDAETERNIIVPNTNLYDIRWSCSDYLNASENASLFNSGGGSGDAADVPATIASVPDGSVCVSCMVHGEKDQFASITTGITLLTTPSVDEDATQTGAAYSIQSGTGDETHTYVSGGTTDDYNWVMGAWQGEAITTSSSSSTTTTSSTTSTTSSTASTTSSTSSSTSTTSSTVTTAPPLGEFFTVQTNVATLGTYYNNQRKLARTSNGDLHCVYYRSDGSINQIYYAKSVDGGENWAETALTAESYAQRHPSIAVDSNDIIHVTWAGKHDGSTTIDQIRYRKYTTSWQAIEELTSESYDQKTPSIAVGSNNYVHIIFWGQHDTSTTYSQIRYLEYTDSWQGIVNLTSASINQQEAAIAIDSNNSVHISWNATNTIEYRERIITTWQDQVQLYDGGGYTQQMPSIAIDSNDYVHVVWFGINSAISTSKINILYKKYTGSWQSMESLTTDTSNSQANPTISIDASDTINVIFKGKSPDSATYTQIRYIYNDGSWSAIDDITYDISTDQQYPNAIWGLHPSINGAKTNRPMTGFAFLWMDGTTLMYFRDFNLTWEEESITSSSTSSTTSTTSSTASTTSSTSSTTSTTSSATASTSSTASTTSSTASTTSSTASSTSTTSSTTSTTSSTASTTSSTASTTSSTTSTASTTSSTSSTASTTSSTASTTSSSSSTASTTSSTASSTSSTASTTSSTSSTASTTSSTSSTASTTSSTSSTASTTSSTSSTASTTSSTSSTTSTTSSTTSTTSSTASTTSSTASTTSSTASTTSSTSSTTSTTSSTASSTSSTSSTTSSTSSTASTSSSTSSTTSSTSSTASTTSSTSSTASTTSSTSSTASTSSSTSSTSSTTTSSPGGYEIRHNTISGLTLYLCRFKVNGSVFVSDGSASEPWGTGGRDADDYDVSMGERGSTSGHYTGRFDEDGNIPAGIYRVTIYRQAGANPADSDIMIAQGEIYWDGSGEITLSDLDTETGNMKQRIGPWY